jgi:ribose 5-phosphate isomerase A
MDVEAAKRLAATSAVELVPAKGVLGLGTGSTTRFFIDAVGELVRSGRKLQAVPTSQRSREQAAALGIPLLEDDGPWTIELCVDGADEVSAGLDLIKGGGGAHTREKIVNYQAKFNVIIVDESKLSERLGEKRTVPIEVVTFGHRTTAGLLERFGSACCRQDGDKPFVTDSGNFIYDLETGPIADAVELEQALHDLPGVVESGLFCGRADLVIVAGAAGVRKLTRS